MLLEGRTAIVTGAASGIGKATAVLFAREGARVCAVDVDEEKLDDCLKAASKAHGECIVAPADVSDPADVEKAVKKAIDKWKRLDVVFANAGINGVWAPVDQLAPEEWDKTLDTNLKGTFLTVKYSVPYLKQRGGSIIITSSVNGNRIFSNAGASAYSSSKAAQVAFAKMTALELSAHRIRVNVICPGAIETNIGESTEKRDIEKAGPPEAKDMPKSIPLTRGKPGRPEQVAQLVLFLASDASDLISGAEVFIDGAESLLQG